MVALLVLVACNGDDGDSDEIVLRIGWWGGDSRHERTYEVIELFEERHPGIRIEAYYAPWGDYWTMLTTMAAADNLPDIIQMDMTRINEFDGNDLLLDLAPFINSGAIDLSHVDNAYQEILQDGARTLGISLGANAFALIYNRDLANEHGISFDPGYTYDEMLANFLVMRATIGDHFMGFDFSDASYEVFNMFVRQFGQPFYGDGALGFDEDILVQFFEMMHNMIEDGTGFPESLRVQLNTAGEAYTNHNIIAGIGASNQIVGRSGETEYELGLALLPRVASGSHSGHWLRSSMQFSITSGTEVSDAAAKFIDFFTNDIEANLILEAERGVPISSEIRNALIDIVPAPVAEQFTFLDVVAANASAVDALPPEGATQFRDAFQRISEFVMAGVTTPADAAQQFMNEAASIFAQMQ